MIGKVSCSADITWDTNRKKKIFLIWWWGCSGWLHEGSFRGWREEGAGPWRWTINGIRGIELVRMNSPFNKLKNTVAVMLSPGPMSLEMSTFCILEYPLEAPSSYITSPNTLGAPGGSVGWASTSAQVMISRFVGSRPASDSVLTAWSLEPASDPVFPSLSAPLPLTFSLSLSLSQKINKKKFLLIKKKKEVLACWGHHIITVSTEHHLPPSLPSGRHAPEVILEPLDQPTHQLNTTRQPRSKPLGARLPSWVSPA